jgi:23S rRNA (guanosine2251-2'-O)-methyltransferase
MQLVILLHNIRSAYNVGSILRTADAAAVKRVICTGTTPYPALKNDLRDPVAKNRNNREIAKTALGAETSVSVEYKNDAMEIIADYKRNGWMIYGLEKTAGASDITKAQLSTPDLLALGSETEGLPQHLLDECSEVLEIPQFGQKESLNVSVAAGIAIYRFVG